MKLLRIRKQRHIALATCISVALLFKVDVPIGLQPSPFHFFQLNQEIHEMRMLQNIASNKVEPIYFLAIGSCLQFSITLLYPSYVSIVPTIAVTATYMIWISVRKREKVISNPTVLQKVYPGRWTAQLLDSDGSMSAKDAHNGVVMFVIGVSSQQYVLQDISPLPNISTLMRKYSPQGRAAPGFQDTAAYFHSMWKDADLHYRAKGCMFAFFREDVPFDESSLICVH